MRLLRILSFILVVSISINTFTNAQNRGFTTQVNRCGTDSLMQELLKDPVYREQYEHRQAIFEEKLKTVKNRVGDCTDPIRLPLAVHFQEIVDPDSDCLRQLTEDQIRILNEDFQGTNADIVAWTDEASANFPGVNHGQACIEFYLATANHPEGYGLVEGEPAITINQFESSENKDFAGYINIFVGPLSALGMSPVGGCGDGDGISIHREHFGSAPDCGTVSPDSPYELGRTLTHEMGHYLNLRHIWGWQINECEEDDRVDDTPMAYKFNHGCPSANHFSCNSLDLHMNYMDYSYDQCMYMFTAGQVARMETWLETNLQNVFNNTAEHCPVCPSQLYLSGSGNSNYQTSGFIIFDGNTLPGNIITANAGTFVLLDVGYTAHYGASFLAYIEGCDNDRTTGKSQEKQTGVGLENTTHPKTQSRIIKNELTINNTPNPFSKHTTFNLNIPKTAHIKLAIYDVKGALIATIINNNLMETGQYQLHFDASSLPNGIYLYQLTTPQKSITKKMLLKK